MERIVIAFGEPQDRLVMSGERSCVAGKSILVVPDDLATVRQTKLIEETLQPTQMVVNAVDKQVPSWGQDPFALREPFLAPRKPLISPVSLLPRTEILV